MRPCKLVLAAWARSQLFQINIHDPSSSLFFHFSWCTEWTMTKREISPKHSSVLFSDPRMTEEHRWTVFFCKSLLFNIIMHKLEWPFMLFIPSVEICSLLSCWPLGLSSLPCAFHSCNFLTQCCCSYSCRLWKETNRNVHKKPNFLPHKAYLMTLFTWEIPTRRCWGILFFPLCMTRSSFTRRNIRHAYVLCTCCAITIPWSMPLLVLLHIGDLCLLHAHVSFPFQPADENLVLLQVYLVPYAEGGLGVLPQNFCFDFQG